MNAAPRVGDKPFLPLLLQQEQPRRVPLASRVEFGRIAGPASGDRLDARFILERRIDVAILRDEYERSVIAERMRRGRVRIEDGLVDVAVAGSLVTNRGMRQPRLWLAT